MNIRRTLTTIAAFGFLGALALAPMPQASAKTNSSFRSSPKPISTSPFRSTR